MKFYMHIPEKIFEIGFMYYSNIPYEYCDKCIQGYFIPVINDVGINLNGVIQGLKVIDRLTYNDLEIFLAATIGHEFIHQAIRSVGYSHCGVNEEKIADWMSGLIPYKKAINEKYDESRCINGKIQIF